MPLFPETVEDLRLIYTKQNPVAKSKEELLDELGTGRDELRALGGELRRCGELTSEYSAEAERYSDELAELTRELSARVKYDQGIAVFRDEFAWYCSCAAALSAELATYSAELALYGDAVTRCEDELDALRRLVTECSAADPHDKCDHARGEHCDRFGDDGHSGSRRSSRSSGSHHTCNSDCSGCSDCSRYCSEDDEYRWM